MKCEEDRSRPADIVEYYVLNRDLLEQAQAEHHATAVGSEVEEERCNKSHENSHKILYSQLPCFVIHTVDRKLNLSLNSGYKNKKKRDYPGARRGTSLLVPHALMNADAGS